MGYVNIAATIKGPYDWDLFSGSTRFPISSKNSKRHCLWVMIMKQHKSRVSYCPICYKCHITEYSGAEHITHIKIEGREKKNSYHIFII